MLRELATKASGFTQLRDNLTAFASLHSREFSFEEEAAAVLSDNQAERGESRSLSLSPVLDLPLPSVSLPLSSLPLSAAEHKPIPFTE